MDPRELADVAKLGKGAANGLGGNVELRRQVLDGDLARLARDGEDLGMSKVLRPVGSAGLLSHF